MIKVVNTKKSNQKKIQYTFSSSKISFFLSKVVTLIDHIRIYCNYLYNKLIKEIHFQYVIIQLSFLNAFTSNFKTKKMSQYIWSKSKLENEIN